MAYSDRDEPDEGTRFSTITQFTEIFVRLAGVLLLLVGLVIGIEVVVEAWDLYRSPEHIERFSWAIEQGSNLDRSIASFTVSRLPSSKDNELPDQSDRSSATEPLKLSYFLAWVIVILLLMLIGRLALAAIRTGGELALYDREVKRFARTLLKETARLRRENEPKATPLPATRKTRTP